VEDHDSKKATARWGRKMTTITSHLFIVISCYCGISSLEALVAMLLHNRLFLGFFCLEIGFSLLGERTGALFSFAGGRVCFPRIFTWSDTPPAGAGGIFGLQAQICLSPSGCRGISRQESGVLRGRIKCSNQGLNPRFLL
jgi:hypothetical protein